MAEKSWLDTEPKSGVGSPLIRAAAIVQSFIILGAMLIIVLVGQLSDDSSTHTTIGVLVLLALGNVCFSIASQKYANVAAWVMLPFSLVIRTVLTLGDH